MNIFVFPCINFEFTWYSLFYNMGTRHKGKTSDMSATGMIWLQQKWDRNGTSKTQVWEECYRNNTSATRVKNFDFDNDKSKNIFSHQYVSYMTNERLQGVEQFHSRSTFWKCLIPIPKYVWKVYHKTELCKRQKLCQKVIH